MRRSLEIPLMLLPDFQAVLMHAVSTGVPVRTDASGSAFFSTRDKVPADARDALKAAGPLLADALRATHAATPMLATIALWWDVAMYTASLPTRRRIAEAMTQRRNWGIAPLRAAPLLALGDVAFPLQTSER